MVNQGSKRYRGIHSIEDSSTDANLRLKNNTLHYLKLELPLRYNLQDPIHYHGLQAPHKYVRLIQRNHNGCLRYNAQLLCGGTPWVKSQHGQMVNQLLQQGTTIKTEKLCYKSFQKLWGKSVGLRTPSMFVEAIQRKAENAGGSVKEINTYQTDLPQTCHCGRKEKKSLKERWYQCSCGVNAQRDLYSVCLACFVDNNQLMADQAQQAWSGMDIALHTAVSKLKRTISRPVPASLGLPGLETVVCTVP